MPGINIVTSVLSLADRTLEKAFLDSRKLDLQWATKVLRHLGIKLNFRASWSHSPLSPQNNVDFSVSSTAQTTAPTQHCIGGPKVLEN